MKKQSKRFESKQALIDLIAAYFKYIEGEYHIELKPPKKAADNAEPIEQKVCAREAEPATITGLTLALGFNSREEFDDYEQSGKYATLVKRARLQVEAAYEKKLHYQAPTGAIFALKSIGWNEKADTSDKAAPGIKKIKVKVIESGPTPAANEKEVSLQD